MAAIVLVAAGAAPAAAEEPLFIRVRPRPEAGVEAARAAREALWARREAHARAVIASVCTGCLGAWRSPAPATGPAERVAALAGLAPDPGSGASEPASGPAIPEERP